MKMEDAKQIATDKKKVLVFDTSKGYSRLIYRFFGNSFDIKQCPNAKTLYSYDIADFDCALVIINHQDDMLCLTHIYPSVKNIFLGARIKDFDHTIYRLDRIIYLNLFDRKTIFLKYLIIKLNEINLIPKTNNKNQ